MVQLFGPSVNQKKVLDRFLSIYFNIASGQYTAVTLSAIVLLIIDDYTSHDLCDELQQLKKSPIFVLLGLQLNNQFNATNCNGQKTFVQSFSPIKLIYLAIFELIEVLNQI